MENKFKSLESVIREMSIDRNTKAREKVVNVGRPDKPALAKQGEIKTKIIDEDHHVHVDDGRNYGSRPHDKDAEHVKAGLEKHGGEFVGHTDKGVSFKFKTPVAAANFRKHVSAAPHKTMFADEPSYYNESKELIDEKKKVEKEDIMFGKGPPDNMSSPSNSQAPVTPTSNATPSMPNVWNNTPSMFQPKMPKITEAKDKNFDDVEVTDKKNSPSPSSKKTKPTDSEDHDLDDAKKVNGGTTDVELNPKTDDKVNSETDEDDSAKKGRKTSFNSVAMRQSSTQAVPPWSSEWDAKTPRRAIFLS